MATKISKIFPKNDTIIFQVNNELITETEFLRKIQNILQECLKENNILLTFDDVFSEIDIISNNDDIYKNFLENLYKDYPELLGGINKYDNLY